ncbi:F0F1 ATP synthase subunit delta [Bacillus lacus]|uniref:ATP synthase subunit delta n=1 Tax=Metabacillus lacus TaxID=1983721 RepID=A0A7X2J2W2_9BACI|nr:F0F1 ATP synthase subunit delta [Metabacillus lacus]MRX74142.1 F0F1 ATP synthase subunit delta [Metabacillus lacus]
MSSGIVAKRYALALFQIAKENQLLDRFEEDMRTVKKVFADNQTLMDVLTHPKITLTQKKSIIGDAFSSLSVHVVNTLLILVEKHRITAVSEIADQYIVLANDERSTEDAVVYSVKPLKVEEIAALSTVFARKIGKASLRLQNVIDPNIIGGVKLRIGNRIYDGSISGKLERIQRQLAAK